MVLVAGEDALDQYFMSHPEDFFSRPAEKAVVNPWNEVILARHLECAAAELPLSARDPWLVPAPGWWTGYSRRGCSCWPVCSDLGCSFCPLLHGKMC